MVGEFPGLHTVNGSSGRGTDWFKSRPTIRVLKMIKPNSIVQGDCLEVMNNIDSQSIDLILCDLPYGITANTWDCQIPLKPLYLAYRRILKPAGAIILTAVQPFTVALLNANEGHFKFYCLVWDKGRGTNFQLAKIRPLRSHEDIIVFYNKRHVYNPQWWYSKPYKVSSRPRANTIQGLGNSSASIFCPETISDGRRYPLSIIKIPKVAKPIHPSQKPIELMAYLIKTYTNEGELVLDNCMGIGTTCLACLQTNRQFIGIEQSEKFFAIAKNSLDTAHETA